jgi:nitrite reductase (cytochrome c-552)
MNEEEIMTNGTPDGGLKSLLAHIPVTRFLFFLASLFVVTVVATVAVTALLVNIYGRKQEARVPFVRVVEVDEATSAPEPWGMNWPRQFESYQRTADTARFYGGSSAMPAQKLEDHPWLVRMYAGYAFALDYREARGHAYMLSDQLATRRITERPQPGACLHCHASAIPTYRRLGLEALNLPADAQALAQEFNWPAVQKGFELTCAMSYPDAHAELLKTPDGTDKPQAHPVSCVDCHDPETMKSRVSRPGFVRGIAALAAGEAEVPHLPSIERWRKGDRSRPYDPNLDASRQEMRSFVCAQCHVEYYCGPKETLFFPWDKGLRVEQIEALYDEHRFPSGEAFSDWKHSETGAAVYKAQHPEFEMWSQGIHARSGVGCADCHMPYQREGAMKVSSHWCAESSAHDQQFLPDLSQGSRGGVAISRHHDPEPAQGVDRSGCRSHDRDARCDSCRSGGSGACRETGPDPGASEEGAVAAGFRQQRELAWVPRRSGVGSDSGRVY